MKMNACYFKTISAQNTLENKWVLLCYDANS